MFFKRSSMMNYFYSFSNNGTSNSTASLEIFAIKPYPLRGKGGICMNRKLPLPQIADGCDDGVAGIVLNLK